MDARGPSRIQLERRLTRFFGPEGRLARAHPGYEPREAQVELARRVGRTLLEGGHLVAEAGTGTGKTLAYLVPPILLGRRVVVSTGTRNLQDQLARSDLPFLRERCRMDVRWCVLKGRDNYLCRHRFELFRAAPTFTRRAESASWPEVVAWAEETATGEAAELVGLPESPAFWPEINARNSTCLGGKCPAHDACHLQEVRRRAAEADVVIVNHHLYLADAALRVTNFGQVLPDCDTVIFDEAHALEEAATSFFGRRVSSWRLRELANDTVTELSRAGLDAPSSLVRAKRLAELASGFSAPWPPGEGRRLLGARLSPAQEDLLRTLRAAVAELARAFDAMHPQHAAVAPLRRRCRELLEDVELIVARDDPGFVHWVEIRGRQAVLAATPIDVSELLREHVFRRLSASASCSATLAVGGRLLHARQRLGLAERAPAGEGESEPESRLGPVREAVLESPFDHASQGLLYLPRSMPEPRDPTFATAVAQETLRLLDASDGRAFLLFTSWANMERVHELVADELRWPAHVQGEAPRAELVRRFLAEEGSVLFATASFWAGVDVPGDALSLVVIDKLPFAVPSDPIFAARARLVEEAGGDPFWDLSVPQAVLALKQGVGRLLRSRSDRGVVALLDRRVTRSRYGRTFLADLPPFRRTGRLDEVREFFDAGREAALQS